MLLYKCNLQISRNSVSNVNLLVVVRIVYDDGGPKKEPPPPSSPSVVLAPLSINAKVPLVVVIATAAPPVHGQCQQHHQNGYRR